MCDILVGNIALTMKLGRKETNLLSNTSSETKTENDRANLSQDHALSIY